MPLNKQQKLDEPKGALVSKVRAIFLREHFSKSPDEFYEQDINLVKNLDFLIQRCVIHEKENVRASVKMLYDMLKWRKLSKIRELSTGSLLKEATFGSACFIYEPDLYGNRMIYFRGKFGSHIPELEDLMRIHMNYVLSSVDDPVEGSTYAIVVDLSNCSHRNCDLNMSLHLLSLIKTRFPGNLDYILIVNFPWILSAMWALFKPIIGEDNRKFIRFINSEQITEYVSPDKVPDFLGGSCKRPYWQVNEQSPTVVNYLIKKTDGTISAKRCHDIINQFKPFLPLSHYEALVNQIKEYEESKLKNISTSTSTSTSKATSTSSASP